MNEMNFILECIVKISAGAFCGFLLGVERKSHNQSVGIRTLILICVSSTLLSILSNYMANDEKFSFLQSGDPTRIVAGVVSGIGFLGGGAIMRQGWNIKGLTSATIIWTSAAFGLAIGAGLYVQVSFALVLSLFLLFALEKLEAQWFPAQKTKTILLCFENESPDMKKIRGELNHHGLIIIDTNSRCDIKTRRTEISYVVKSPEEDDFSDLINSLKRIGNLAEFSVAD